MHLINCSFVNLSHLMTKPTKWHVRPVWSESSLHAQWVAKDPSFLHADSEDSYQTGRMPRLIWVFTGHTCHLLVLSWGGSFKDGQSVVVCDWHSYWFIKMKLKTWTDTFSQNSGQEIVHVYYESSWRVYNVSKCCQLSFSFLHQKQTKNPGTWPFLLHIL